MNDELKEHKFFINDPNCLTMEQFLELAHKLEKLYYCLKEYLNSYYSQPLGSEESTVNLIVFIRVYNELFGTSFSVYENSFEEVTEHMSRNIENFLLLAKRSKVTGYDKILQSLLPPKL